MTVAWLTFEEVREIFPDMDPRKAAVVLVDGRIYEREHEGFRLLDDRANRTTAEFAGYAGDNGRCRAELVNGS